MTGADMKANFGAIILACAVLTGFLQAAALAADPVPATDNRFFESLYDVPVMPGMAEFPDQALLFDKPDGRIASVAAGSKDADPARVQGFYDDTLSQMGWRKTAKNQYVRGKDRLDMVVERQAGLTIVRFTLSPARREKP